MVFNWFQQLTYILGAACFVLALKWMSGPKTARKGLWVGIAGMAIAVLGTLTDARIVSYEWIVIAFVIGALIGIPMGQWMKMTAMPQRTALSHAFGALAAALVGTAEYLRFEEEFGKGVDKFTMFALGLEVLLGFLTFTGSLMAFGKLAEVLPQRPITYKGQNYVNLGVLGLAIACVVMLIIDPSKTDLWYVFCALSLIFGVMLIIPIGGADMPTVISLLNSYAGLSGAAMGFVLHNNMLIVAGSLDGASGLFLSIIMCRAMNRSFINVLFGGFGQIVAKKDDDGEEKIHRTSSPEEAAMMIDAAQSVIIVPGYGMAVAQAQHKVADLATALTKKGISVKFAIHPVAGRMPGHMNVLLAEANVPYDQLSEMEEVNPEFEECDVAIVIGANDVTNPAAKTDESSPIYGMPVLDVEKAKQVYVIKRSMNPGFAGIDNPLYYLENTAMLFGDAKEVAGELVTEFAKLGAMH
ncbi:MAG: NAD(P)(+) transhydrogenase (Re/Si-specific) subunit beta [Actinobacteria bacterium]|nr:NAD(P)(+) transhydrogenase (Re/Si-specific) subunit beta [Actinomycetota bacterium]